MDDGSGKGNHLERVFREMDQIEECLHRYRTRLSPNLTPEEKEKLMWSIYDLRFEQFLKVQDYPASRFPQLKKYWKSKTLSGLELLVVENTLYKELHEPNEGE